MADKSVKLDNESAYFLNQVKARLLQNKNIMKRNTGKITDNITIKEALRAYLNKEGK